MDKIRALKFYVVPFIFICLATFLYAKVDDLLPVRDSNYQEKAETLIRAIETGSVHVTENQFVEFLRLSVHTNNAVASQFLSLRNVFKSLAILVFLLALLQCGVIAYMIRTKR